jgi:pyrroline-5-carboxylate reductase
MGSEKIGIIGAGNMGGAIARGIVTTGLYDGADVLVCDAIAEKAETLARDTGVVVAPNAVEAARAATAVLIAVKPQNMNECLGELNGAVQPAHLIISIAAGITTGFIERGLGSGTRVVRVMPNTPALVKAGTTAICAGTHATEDDLAAAERIFRALGNVYRVDESLMDAVTAVSGSGPAYLFLFAECLEKAARQVGLPAETSAEIATHTLLGAAKLLAESGEPASVLRQNVASPGGTTEAAIAVLNERGFEEMLIAAVERAHARAKELGGMKEN